MTDRDASRTRESIERDGAAIGLIRRDGSRPPVVLVHGVMADAAGWQPVVDAMDVPAEVVAVDRRGRASSSEPGADYSVRTEIDDLHAVLDSLGDGAHLIGHSYGAMIATETAVERSDVRSLTLYDPVGPPFGAELVEPIRTAVDGGDLDRAVEIINIDLTGFSPEHVDELRTTPAWPALCELARPLAREMAAANAYTPRYDEYAGIGVPVTLVAGELSEATEVYGGPFRRFAGHLPAARRETLPGLGHLAHVDAPDVLGRLFGEVVTRHR